MLCYVNSSLFQASGENKSERKQLRREKGRGGAPLSVSLPFVARSAQIPYVLRLFPIFERLEQAKVIGDAVVYAQQN